MEFAVVSHRGTVALEIDPVARRLADLHWAALYADGGYADAAARLARSLGVAVTIEVVPLPAELSLTCCRANRHGLHRMICLNDTLYLTGTVATTSLEEGAELT